MLEKIKQIFMRKSDKSEFSSLLFLAIALRI